MAEAVPLLRSCTHYLRMLRSQYWGRERLRLYQRDRLQKTLEAAAAIPFYGSQFRATPDAESLNRLPLLQRSQIPELNRSVRSFYPANQHFASDRSSGSTGMPVEFLFDASHQHSRFAARIRYLRANGWSPLSRNAWIIYLPEDTPDGQLIRSRLLANTYFLSAFTDVSEQVRWLRWLDPYYVYTLPSNLEALVDAFEARGVRLSSLRGVFCGGEVLDDVIRARTRNVLGVAAVDNYGSTEAFLAWQCPQGSYHVNAEHVLLEVVDDEGRPVKSGHIGKVLLTTLHNYCMPLVRYEIGDYAVPVDGSCPCGRTLPLLGRVVGRSVNLFRLEDGRRVSPWALVVRLKHCDQLRQFQIVQRTCSRYLLRFVAESGLGPEQETTLRRDFGAILGDAVEVTFERVSSIPRSPTGKFMTALSEVAQYE